MPFVPSSCSVNWVDSWMNRGVFCIKRHSWHYTILDTWGWCTGMTQRDGMGREEGGGFRMGVLKVKGIPVGKK